MHSALCITKLYANNRQQKTATHIYKCKPIHLHISNVKMLADYKRTFTCKSLKGTATKGACLILGHEKLLRCNP